MDKLLSIEDCEKIARGEAMPASYVLAFRQLAETMRENERLKAQMTAMESAALKCCAEYDRRSEQGPKHMKQYNLERCVGAGDVLQIIRKHQ